VNTQPAHAPSGSPGEPRSRRPGRLLLVATLITVAAAILARVTYGLLAGGDQPIGDGTQLWKAAFPQGHALITNERAHTEPELPGVHTSPAWVVTSGSLFADNGTGWSGPVDDGSPDADSARSTGSAVFRAVTRRTDFANVTVSLALNVTAMTTTGRTGRREFDGVHLMLRYASPQSLYTVSMCRRDGTTAVKRKTSDDAIDDEGTYTTLAQAPLKCDLRSWDTFRVQVRNTGDGVRITLWKADQQIVTVLDTGQGGAPPLTAPGRVGVRGDNTEFHLRDFTVDSSG
jgi:hypothetical protein